MNKQVVSYNNIITYKIMDEAQKKPRGRDLGWCIECIS